MAYTSQAWQQPVMDAVRGGVYYDNVNSGSNAVAAFTPMCLATPTEVASCQTAGTPNAQFGSTFVPAPITSSFSTRPVIGIAMESAYSGLSISVCAQGVFPAIADAAITAGNQVFPVHALTRTNQQTPFTNVARLLLQIMALPSGSTPTLTYNLVTVDDPTITPASGATANVLYYPIGIALAAATAQYDIIPVLLQTQQFWA